MTLGRKAVTGAIALLSLGLLGACGVFYTAPSVSTGSVFGHADTDLKVDVVRMTFESTSAANLTRYVPARLPLGFQPEAVAKLTGRTASTPRLGPLPAPPSRPGSRPGFIADNLPPLEGATPYLIGVADVLLLAVNAAGATLDQLPALIAAQSKRQGFVVQGDGAIAIPEIGRIQVAGKTMQDAEAVIFQTLVRAGIDPSFSLEIAEFNSQRVSIGGEVRAPALVPITLKMLYLHEAINSAGGLAVADPKVAKIQLIRGATAYQIGVQRFLSDPAMRQIGLRDGDSIVVTSEFSEERARALFSEQLALRQQIMTDAQFRAGVQAQVQSTLSAAESLALQRLQSERAVFKDRIELGAVRRDYAYLAGEAREPHRFTLPFETKAVLADVLFDKSGLDIRNADYGEIYVLRRSTNPEEAGAVTAYHLDADNAANLSLASMFEMHAGDVVFVTEQPITSWNRAFSQILPSLFLSAANAATGF